jgi:hypothetical protein
MGLAAKGGAAAAGTAAGSPGYGVLASSANAPAAAGWNGAAQFAGAAGGGGGAAAAGGLLSKPATGMFLQAGMGLISNYMQARQEEEYWDRVKPRGFFGVGLNGTPSHEGPLPGGRDAQGNIAPMWTNAPPRTPPNAPEFTGNPALDSGFQQAQTNSFLDAEHDPTAEHIGGRRG